jgi:hypothetical protein
MVSEKLCVMIETEEIGNCAAGRKFDIRESCVEVGGK